MDPTTTRVDLPPDTRVDHALGSETAEITLIEYGSFRCPFCHAAHDVLADLRDRFGERLRYVFRHRPLAGDDLARQASVLAEYANETTGQYWPAHDAMMKQGPSLSAADLIALTERLGLPPRHAGTEEAWRRARAKVERDIASGRRSGAHVSPTFYINGRRYEGAWDENTLAEAMLGSLGHRLQSAALDFARWAPSAGLLLLVMTLLAIAAVNSPLGPAYEALWRQPVGLQIGSAAFRLLLHDWINDGLLTIFFLVVGLEIKRELTVGRLASRRLAALPAAAAAGGMLVPASIYLLLVPPAFVHGWAIPTTTDTAFAIAVIALLGRRVPVELRIFLTAAVIVDDLVAIVLVAVFYSGHIDGPYVAGALLVTGLLALLNRSGIYRPLPYALLGIVLWACLHAAGLHPTLAGVVVAIVTPTRPPPNLRALMAQAETVLHHEIAGAREQVLRHGVSEPALRALDAIHDRIESPADKLLRTVEPWSSYLVLPLFALANGALDVSVDVFAGHERLILAIVLGLVLGKPIGMMLAAILAARAGIAVKPEAYTWRQLAGAGALAGIGFTMSLYIAAKAFPDDGNFTAAKFGVFLASVIAAGGGSLLLWRGRSVTEKEPAD